ncbi:hypothetical protein V8E52_002949 [Russula decolorans]
MSASSQTAAPSADNLTTIFKAATDKYQKLTGIRLDTHPFTAQLDACQNPEAISNFLRTEAQAFSKFRKGDERLMVWLDPTIHILFSFSATLGEEIGLTFSPARTIFTGIGVLLGVCFSPSPSLFRLISDSQTVRDVMTSHGILIRLFERMHFLSNV